DGNLLMAGNNAMSENPPNPPTPGSPAGGWLMKVSPNGEPLWAKRTHAGLGMTWESVAEGDDGSIYTGGYHGHTIIVDYGAILVGKFKPNGDYVGMVTVGEAM